MTKEDDLQRIRTMFRSMGKTESHADYIARAQVEQGESAVARELFLHLAKDACIWSSNPEQIKIAEETSHLDLQQSAINQLLQAGGAKQDILDVIRFAQFETLAVVFQLMDDPTMLQNVFPDGVDAEELGVSWGFCQLDDDGNLVGPIDSLHESISPDEL